MLRRVFDGLLLALLAWFTLARLEAGGVAVGLVLAAVFAFSGWRIAALWRKYRRLVHELAAAEAARLSDDPEERRAAERRLAGRRLQHASDMTLWTGFVLGAAAVDGGNAASLGATGGYDGVGADIGGGGFVGGAGVAGGYTGEGGMGGGFDSGGGGGF